MSNSVRPHRRQPTRLRRPWDSPGKNTGVGCHFLLQCSKVKSESEVAESCPTLSDLMDCSLPASSVHGIFQARVLEWGANAFSRALARDRFLMLFLLTQMLIISVLKHFRWSFSNFPSKIGFLCHSGTICTILQRMWSQGTNSMSGFNDNCVGTPGTNRTKPRQDTCHSSSTVSPSSSPHLLLADTWKAN